jgi:hypothetical protein
MTDVLQTLLATFNALQLQEVELLAACKGNQRAQFEEKYKQARKAYWAYLDGAFKNDDDEVAALATQLNVVNAWLANATKEMGDMSKVLDQIDKALSLGEQLAAKAALL